MTPALAFQVASAVPLVGWLALVFLPRSRLAVDGVARLGVPALLAAAYAVIIGGFVFGGTGMDFGSFASLEGIGGLLSQPWLLVAGWLHYLAFDLFVGAWEVRTAQDEGISHWLVVPCLLLTFLLGPVGFLAFLGVRALVGRR